MEKVEIIVEGMMCKNCARHVEEACKKVNGVKDAKVDLDKKTVTVKGEGFELDKIKENINLAGYKA